MFWKRNKEMSLFDKAMSLVDEKEELQKIVKRYGHDIKCLESWVKNLEESISVIRKDVFNLKNTCIQNKCAGGFSMQQELIHEAFRIGVQITGTEAYEAYWETLTGEEKSNWSKLWECLRAVVGGADIPEELRAERC